MHFWERLEIVVSLLMLSFASDRFSSTNLQSDKKTTCHRPYASSRVARMLIAFNRAIYSA